MGRWGPLFTLAGPTNHWDGLSIILRGGHWLSGAYVWLFFRLPNWRLCFVEGIFVHEDEIQPCAWHDVIISELNNPQQNRKIKKLCRKVGEGKSYVRCHEWVVKRKEKGKKNYEVRMGFCEKLLTFCPSTRGCWYFFFFLPPQASRSSGFGESN